MHNPYLCGPVFGAIHAIISQAAGRDEVVQFDSLYDADADLLERISEVILHVHVAIATRSKMPSGAIYLAQFYFEGDNDAGSFAKKNGEEALARQSNGQFRRRWR